MNSQFVQNATLSDGKEDFSDLAPNQRRKRLKQRIEELQSKVQQETAARQGLMKMKIVYESNPALGDPMTVEGIYTFSSPLCLIKLLFFLFQGN